MAHDFWHGQDGSPILVAFVNVVQHCLRSSKQIWKKSAMNNVFKDAHCLRLFTFDFINCIGHCLIACWPLICWQIS